MKFKMRDLKSVWNRYGFRAAMEWLNRKGIEAEEYDFGIDVISLSASNMVLWLQGGWVQVMSERDFSNRGFVEWAKEKGYSTAQIDAVIRAQITNVLGHEFN